MGSKNEQVRYWRGLSSSIPSSIISGRLLFEEDTGNVFFDYKDYNNGELKRVQLTDTSKININGGTFTGEVILFRNPEKDNEAVTKSYADVIQRNLDEHISDKVVHITSTERSKWNNKVDSEDGKGLSTNDFTTSLKNKLNGIEDGATRVEVTTEYNPTSSQESEYYNLGIISIDGDEYTIYAPIPTDISGNAATATKLQTPISIDGVMWDGDESDVSHYAICNTAAGTKVKEVTLQNFAFETGSLIYVNFRYGNSVAGAQLKLNVSDTSKTYDITYLGENIESDQIYKGIYTFVYVGGANPRFEMVASVDTKYGEATENSPGLLSPEDKAKLDSIEEDANNYVLPIAKSNLLGGVMIGDNVTCNSLGKISVTFNNIVEALGFQPLSEDSIDSDVIIELLEVFQGATDTDNGTYGLVPTPYAGDQDSILRGDGNWCPISDIINHQMVKDIVEEVLDEFGIDPTNPPEEGGSPVNPSGDMFIGPVNEPSATPYAIFSEDNGSLNFYQRSYRPEVGDTFNGITVSRIFPYGTYTSSTSEGSGGSLAIQKDDYREISNGVTTLIKDLGESVLSVTTVDEVISKAIYFTDSSLIPTKSSTYAGGEQYDTNAVDSIIPYYPNCASIDLTYMPGYKNAQLKGFLINYSNLYNVTIPLDTANPPYDLDLAFYGCSGLMNIFFVGSENINPPTSYASGNSKVMNYAFYGCSILSWLDLSWFLGYMKTEFYKSFEDCEWLSSIAVSDSYNESSSLTTVTCFSNCTSLQGHSNGTYYQPGRNSSYYAKCDGGFFTHISDIGNAG